MQSKNHFRTLKLLYVAIAGILVFMVIISLIAFYITVAGEVDKDLETGFQFIVAGTSLLSLLVGFSIFKKRLVAVRNSPRPAAKRMEFYTTTCVLWWAFIECPGNLGIVAFMVTRNYAFLALALFHLALLAMFMPRKGNIAMLLNLNSEEVQRLEGKIK